MDEWTESEWIEACSKRLQQRWQRIDLQSLRAVSEQLRHDAVLRTLPPQQAAVDWLRRGIPVP